MLPTSPVYEVGYAEFGDAVSVGYHIKSHPGHVITTKRNNLLILELRSGNSFTSKAIGNAPSALVHVLHIFGPCSCTKVGRVHASRVVA